MKETGEQILEIKQRLDKLEEDQEQSRLQRLADAAAEEEPAYVSGGRPDGLAVGQERVFAPYYIEGLPAKSRKILRKHCEWYRGIGLTLSMERPEHVAYLYALLHAMVPGAYRLLHNLKKYQTIRIYQ
jgi:hypothetical protein